MQDVFDAQARARLLKMQGEMRLETDFQATTGINGLPVAGMARISDDRVRAQLDSLRRQQLEARAAQSYRSITGSDI